MKTLQKTIAISVLAAFTFTACTKKPEASFGVDQSTAKEGVLISFYNTSENAETASWDFGDGTTTDEYTPYHGYTDEGDYTVTLTVKSENGKKSSSTSKVITISGESHKFKGKMNGEDKLFLEHLDYSVMYNQNTDFGTSSVGETEYGSTFFPLPFVSDMTEQMEIFVGTCYSAQYLYPEDTEFEAFVQAKSYAYTTDAKDGVYVSYTDVNGKEWRSDMGAATQTGSSFVITSVEDPYFDSTIPASVIDYRATFNCKLYDGLGGSITLTDGYLFAGFANDF